MFQTIKLYGFSIALALFALGCIGISGWAVWKFIIRPFIVRWRTPPAPSIQQTPGINPWQPQQMVVTRESIPVFTWVIVILNGLFFSVAVALMTGNLLLSTGVSFWQRLYSANGTSLGLTMLVLQLAYTLASFQSVYENEWAILLFFGKYIKDVTPGPVYVPWFLCELLMATKNIIERDLPASPELIYTGDTARDGGGRIPDGLFAPIRVTFGPPSKEEPIVTDKDGKTRTIPLDDAYNFRMTAEVEASYGFRICNLRRFYEEIESLEKATSLMDDVAVGEFTDVFSKITPAEAQTKLNVVSDQVKTALTLLAQPWGVEVTVARIKPIGFSHTLNSAVTSVPTARENKKKIITDSEAEKQKRTNEGIGTANAAQELLEATAAGQEELALVASTLEGQYAMAVDAARVAASYRNFAVISDGNPLAGLLGIGGIWKALHGDLPEINPTPSGPNPPEPTPAVTNPQGRQNPGQPQRPARRTRRRNG